jgi:hypothetical protein
LFSCVVIVEVSFGVVVVIVLLAVAVSSPC